MVIQNLETPERQADVDPSLIARVRSSPRIGTVLTLARVVVVLAVVAAIVLAVAHDWSAVHATIGRMTWLNIALAVGTASLALLANSKAWHALLRGTGTELHAAHASQIYLTGQLARYLPGSIWAFVLQAHLGRRHDVARNRSLVALLIAFAVTSVTGMCLAMAAIPALRAKWGVIAWLLVLAPLGLIVLIPRLLTYVTNKLLALMRRPPLTDQIPGGAIARAAGWSVVAWSLFGMQLWILVGAVHSVGVGSFLEVSAAFSIAVCAGFFAFVLPSGVGVREAVLVAALSGVLGGGPALAVALVSRLVCTAADVLSAAASVAVSRFTERLQRLRAERSVAAAG